MLINMSNILFRYTGAYGGNPTNNYRKENHYETHKSTPFPAALEHKRAQTRAHYQGTTVSKERTSRNIISQKGKPSTPNASKEGDYQDDSHKFMLQFI